MLLLTKASLVQEHAAFLCFVIHYLLCWYHWYKSVIAVWWCKI